MLTSVIGTKDTTENKTDKVPALIELTSQWNMWMNISFIDFNSCPGQDDLGYSVAYEW